MIDVLCAGEVIWDVFERGPRVLHREPGGASANVAIALARLGVRAAVAACVGWDKVGDALVARLAEEGVETRWLARVPLRTGMTFVHVGDAGEGFEPSFTNYRQGTADGAEVLAAPARAAWVVAGTSASSSRVVFAARGGVALDLNARPLLWKSRARAAKEAALLVARSDVVKASDVDLEALAPGLGVSWLRRHARPGAVLVVTRGARGAVAYVGAVDVAVPPRRARVVDATGAGDAFLGGLLAALVAARVRPGSLPFRDPRFWADALDLGHRLGAKAVTRVGATRGLVGLYSARARMQEIATAWQTRG